MDELKRAVKNALELYAETSGMTLQEVGKRFAESAACRENVYRKANRLRYGVRLSDGLAVFKEEDGTQHHQRIGRQGQHGAAAACA